MSDLVERRCPTCHGTGRRPHEDHFGDVYDHCRDCLGSGVWLSQVGAPSPETARPEPTTVASEPEEPQATQTSFWE